MPGPVDVLVERIVLWLRPLRREMHPTRIDPLNVPLDIIDTPAIIDTSAPYPTWIQRHPRAVAEWDWSRNDPARDPWDATGVSRKAWWVCDEGHSWETSPQVRGQAESSCPYCISRTPKRCSRSDTWRDTAALDMPSASAAPTKLPASATPANTHISWNLSIVPIF